MKVRKLECPYCKATLEVEPGRKIIKCSYCRQKVSLEKDIEDVALENFEKVSNQVFNTQRHVVIPFFIFTFIIFILIAIAAFTGFDRTRKTSNSTFDDFEERIKAPSFLVDLDKLKEEDVKAINEKSLEKLNNYKGVVTSDYVDGAWEYVGTYLLVSSGNLEIKYYDVFKKTYTFKGVSNSVYGCVLYNKIKMNDDRVDMSSVSGTANVKTIKLDNNNSIYGYKTLEALYDDLISLYANIYSMQTTNGLYIG